MNSLKTAKEHLQKQNEDLINTLKEVSIFFSYFFQIFYFSYFYCSTEWESSQRCTTDSYSFQVKEQQVTMEEKFRNELNANIKLSNLYKVFLISILAYFFQI